MAAMDTVRDGLKQGALEKDTFDRLVCVSCGRALKMRNDPEELGRTRFCEKCGSEWLEVR